MIMINIEVFTLIMLMVAFGVKKHALSLLIMLEFLSLLIILITLKLGLDIFFRLMLLCVGACEGAVGLGTLIRISRVLNFRLVTV